MSSITKCLLIIVLSYGIIVSISINNSYATDKDYSINNKFSPNDFPGEVSSKVFSIPLEAQEVIVVYPHAMESNVQKMQSLLTEKCGSEIAFWLADDIGESDIGEKHLIVVGNISNNQWLLELYRHRYAFADANLPGKGGVIIHPSSSLWNREKNVLVIGVSTNEDITIGFETFVGLLKDGVKTIGAMHYLKTSLKFPKPLDSVEPIFDKVREDLGTSRAPYESIADWGLLYFLTGEKKWAEHFRNGMYFLYERGEKTGKWIPEAWTLVYFSLWKMVMVWDLLDDDSLFTMKDRRIIEDVLWGYTQFTRGRPYIAPQFTPPGEPRQNHTTYLGLSLYYAYTYYTEKYGITGLDSMAEKFHITFDQGMSSSYRSNDDAAGYIQRGSLHYLTYIMAEGDNTFLEEGRLKTYIDLLAATVDNRRDQVGYGDVTSYTHRTKESSRGIENFNISPTERKFFGMAAWYYGDGQYQWLYNWISGVSQFNIAEMHSGLYAVDIEEEEPTRFLGVFPVILDGGSLRWSARRSEKKSQLPNTSEQYFDKLSFRPSFDPQDEYLLLDGMSTMAHGHYDGNTITRLTWKDRIWLFDLDYIKLTPRYHNGVTIVCDGVQKPPPPLTSLDYNADFNTFGFTRSTSRDFNGADWGRNIIWKKGRYFLFLDQVTARKNGDFRLENRWHTRGDVVERSGNVLSVQQGDKSFYIKSADDASRNIVIDPDGYRRDWDYPYGNGKMSVCLAQKNMAMARNSEWIFANLMYAVDDSDTNPIELYKISDDFYLISDSGNHELVGLRPDILEAEGVYTDCSLFFKNTEHTWFIDASRLKFEDVSFEAPANVNIEIDYRKSTGKLVVPEGSGGLFYVKNLFFKDVIVQPGKNNNTLKLNPGTYDFTFRKDSWKNKMSFKSLVHTAHRILPEYPSNKIVDFGIEIIQKIDISDTITSFYPNGSELIFADKKGRIKKYDGKNASLLFRIPSQRPIKSVHAADINGDGKAEIIAGDDSENLYCFDDSGGQLWTYKMTPYYPQDANVVDITVGDIDGSGTNTLLVATNSWKLYAFKPDGSVKWESFVYYHPLTKVEILKTASEKTYIAVGNVYHTPLNIVDPVDGNVIWNVWEQMGSESRTVTDYCGTHLTDMVFVDTDDDGEKDIVFGTEYSRVNALNAADGSTKWQATVGDEVTAMKLMDDLQTGEKRILVATDGGELFLFDKTGKRLDMVTFGSGISDMEILSFPEHKRNDIILTTNDGRVIICDNDFLIRASVVVGNAPVKGIILGEKSGEEYQIYSVSDSAIHLLKYHPYFLKKSRHY